MTKSEFKKIDNKITDVRIQVDLGTEKKIIDQMLFAIQTEIAKTMD